MLREWFRTRSPFPEWRALKWLVAGDRRARLRQLLVRARASQAHAFYVVAPVAFMFAAYCWTFVDSPRWRRIAAAVLAANIAFHAGQAWIQAPMKSLYRNREVVATAIRLKQPEMFAHRRPFAIAGGPAFLQDPSRPHDGRQDIQFSDTRFERGPGGAAFWTVTLRTATPGSPPRRLYQTHYRDESGQVVVEQHDCIEDVFQPGAVAGWK